MIRVSSASLLSRMRASRSVIDTLATKTFAQMLGLQKISKKTSLVYRYSIGLWGMGLPPPDIYAVLTLKIWTISLSLACNSLAASGVKLQDTEPLAKLNAN